MAQLLVIPQFDVDNPPDVPALNNALAILASAINSLAGSQLVTLSASPGNTSGGFVPDTGGVFLGAVQAPSMSIGPKGETTYSVISSKDKASTAKAGIVKMAAAVVDLSQGITNPPTQAEVLAVQNKCNEVLAVLRAAEAMVP